MGVRQANIALGNAMRLCRPYWSHLFPVSHDLGIIPAQTSALLAHMIPLAPPPLTGPTPTPGHTPPLATPAPWSHPTPGHTPHPHHTPTPWSHP